MRLGSGNSHLLANFEEKPVRHSSNVVADPPVEGLFQGVFSTRKAAGVRQEKLEESHDLAGGLAARAGDSFGIVDLLA